MSTKSRSWIATSSKEAITLTSTFDFAGWDANTGLAGFAIGAEICVIADGVVGFNRIRAQACGCIAYADLMAVIQGSTNDGITGLAYGVFTDVVYGTAVGVVTGGAVGLWRIVADPGFWDADTYVMALAKGIADYGG